MEPELTQAPTEQPAEAAPDTSVDSMMEFLGGDEKPAETEGAPGEATAEEAHEASADAEEDDGEEEAEPTEAKPEEPAVKKASRNQRLKAQRDQAFAEATQAKKDRQELLGVTNHWRAHAKAVEAEFRRVLQETGYKYDPRDAELFAARRERERLALEQHTAKEVERIDAETVQQTQKAQLVDEFRTQANALVKKHPGLAPHQILKAYVLSEEAGMGLTMEQVAADLSRHTRSAPNPAREQLKVNRAAPKPLRGGKGVLPTFTNSTDDMEAFLLSVGQKG